VAHAATGSLIDEDRALATITVAFSNDPVTRWVFEDPLLFLSCWPMVAKAYAGAAFPSGTADAIDDHAGVALWLPPGVGALDEALGARAFEAVPEPRRDEASAFFGQSGAFRLTEPHWYLSLIAVDVVKQGLGYGSELLRRGLARCDADRLPAFLEATSPRSKALYERHGFEAIGVIQHGSSPPMWPMLRAVA
jgi:GNAT superfamily N-acetyltransferase